LDFRFDDEHAQIRETLRAFFTAEAPPALIAELDATETYPREILSRMADLGLWGAAVPERYGGSPLDHVGRCLVVEEVQRAGACLGYAYVPTALFCADALSQFGTEIQREEMLPRLAEGRLRMAMALSEPEVGSDLMSLSTRGRIDGETIAINGQKTFITGADVADLLLVLIRTSDEERASRSLSFVFVPREAAGLTVVPLKKLAGQATHTCEVFLDDVRVPLANLLGDLDGAARILFPLLDADRVYTAAQSLGVAQGAFDLATSYARERVQFGKPIIEHQAVGHMLADMALRTEGARLMTMAAAWRLDEGLPCSREASMAKIAASEAGTFCAGTGMQVLGGYSYMTEYGMERFYRESKIQEIFGGTNQILRNAIARELAADS
jgi:alkylation response protein AidB-like acyl-CoA dehydrogenase